MATAAEKKTRIAGGQCAECGETREQQNRTLCNHHLRKSKEANQRYRKRKILEKYGFIPEPIPTYAQGAYTLYKGEAILATGTIYEIADQQDINPTSIAFLKTPSYKARVQHSNNAKVLVEETA